MRLTLHGRRAQPMVNARKTGSRVVVELRLEPDGTNRRQPLSVAPLELRERGTDAETVRRERERATQLVHAPPQPTEFVVLIAVLTPVGIGDPPGPSRGVEEKATVSASVSESRRLKESYVRSCAVSP